jgi:hypothetical protein
MILKSPTVCILDLVLFFDTCFPSFLMRQRRKKNSKSFFAEVARQFTTETTRVKSAAIHILTYGLKASKTFEINTRRIATVTPHVV